MKSRSHFGLSRLLLLILLALAHGGLTHAAVLPGVEFTPKTIRGNVRFSNIDPTVLDILGPPGNEGIGYWTMFAYSVAPNEGLSAVAYALAPDLIDNPYEVTASSAEGGVAYSLSARLALDGNREEYWTLPKTTPLLSPADPDPTIDFEECVGLLELEFVTDAGDPVALNGLRGFLYQTSDQLLRAALGGDYSGNRNYLAVPADTEFRLALEVNVGTDSYSDRMTYSTTIIDQVGCDAIKTVKVIIPSNNALGRIAGEVAIEGEFLLSTPGYLDLKGRTAVVAVGPGSTRRLALVPGDNNLVSASGPFTLEGLIPSADVDPAVPWAVHAEMHLHRIPNFEFFVTPWLGSGANPGVDVAAGETVDLADTFRIQPAYVTGHIHIEGPAETPDHPIGLKAANQPALADLDGDGIYDSAGIYGIAGPFVQSTGIDRLPEGATLTASGGYGEVGFDAQYDPANAALSGDYQMVLGGLKGEKSVWKTDVFHLSLYSEATNGMPYFYEEITVTDQQAPEMELSPGDRQVQDIRYGFSEICLRFRSTDTPFYNPQVRFTSGQFQGRDFEGVERDYRVYLDAAFGSPYAPADAAQAGLLVFYLPQGTYTLQPYVTSVLPDGSETQTQLEAIPLTVGDRQKICLERCLRLSVTPPACPSPTGHFVAQVQSCDNPVSVVTYSLNGAAPVDVCTDCGINPSLDFTAPLVAGDNTLVVTAQDSLGGMSTVTLNISPSQEPPTIVCPDNIVTTQNSGCGTAVPFEVIALDHCDGPVTVVSTPSSGSVFPIGDTTVTCIATDAAGNTSQCEFVVTVTPGGMTSSTLVAVTPTSLPSGGGSTLTITGTGLTATQTILIGGQPLLSPVWVSAEEIQGLSPALPAGSHEVELVDCGGTIARLSPGVEVSDLPSISSVEPGQVYARGGTRVIVHGSNFLPGTRVRIGFPLTGGANNQLVNVTVSEDGTTLSGDAPPLPSGELFGPRNVIAFDPRGEFTYVGGLSYVPDPLETDTQVLSLRELEAACAEALSITFRNGFPVGMNVSVRAAGATPEERARAFVRVFKPLLKQRDPDADLQTRSVTEGDMDHVRLAQFHQGIPVFGGEVVVSLAGDEVLGFTGSLLPTSVLDPNLFVAAPALTVDQAEQAARAALNLPNSPVDHATHLQVFDESLLHEGAWSPHLVWRVTLKGAAEELFVDAASGEVVFRLDLSEGGGGDLHGFDLDLQDAEEEANAQDDWCFNLSSDTDVADEDWFNSDYNGDADAVQLNTHARNAYAFFHRNFNWHSYDNDSSQVELFIHATIANGPNAQWVPNCELIQFSTGMIDYEVMVHELTHGVVSSTSGLIYKFESGALNESYADAMGVVADREAGDLNWFLAENLTGNPGVPIRDIQNPGIDMRSKYLNVPGNNDAGGVHSNSGIGNKTVFLMTQGGDFNGRRVRNGMGLSKTRDLKWEALRNLPNNAGYDAARAMEVAIALGWAKTGSHGFTSENACTVRNTWAAVGVGNADFNCDGIEEEFLDSDKDYIPDRFDNCRFNANPGQEDVDHDGVGDVCDNCKATFNPDQKDTDLDGIGDVCDPDIDNDGCVNSVDQHPDSAVARIGTVIGINCPGGNRPLMGFEGQDTDHDGKLDCEDLDDDNDGIPDDQDGCPLGNLPGALAGCSIIEDCPVLDKDWWRVCLGGGCNQFDLRFRDRVNPNPETDIIVDQVRILNRTLYLFPNVGSTAAQTAKAIAGKAGIGLAGAESGWRMELWTKATADQPSHLLAVVGDYDPASIQLQQLASGNVLAIAPASGASPTVMGATWFIGGNPEEANADADHDGLPDGWEIQHGLDPRNPLDADRDDDGDGVSNRDEYDAGTDPQNPESFFQILGADLSARQVQITFLGTVGRRYQLERTEQIGAPVWKAVGQALSGRPAVLTLTDSDPGAGPTGFYRVRSSGE